MSSVRNLFRSTAFVLSLFLIAQQVADAAIPQQGPATSPSPATIYGPVPKQITAARTIFLSNFGTSENFTIDATRGFKDIFAALQAWGHYQLVGSPEEADLVFQLRGIAPTTEVSGYDGSVYSNTNPAYLLTIFDPKTKITLWTITSPAPVAGRSHVYARWVSIAETNLVSRIKVLAGQPLSGTETADLATIPKIHTATGTLVLVGILAAGLAGGIILHHEYENRLANQKASQDAFCTANHIPLSECPGG